MKFIGGAGEKWVDKKNIELILILRGHIKLLTYNSIVMYFVDIIRIH
jgi:hypothetical protein